MSQLIVEVKRVDKIRPHSNADKLEIVEVGGWQVCSQKGAFKEGSLVIYVPPDTLVPQDIADKWGVAAYLSKGERVKCVRLRGEPSFGFIVPNEGNWPEGFSVVEHYGLKKYVPPAPRNIGYSNKSSRVIPTHPLFVKYTDIDNLRHYPKIIEDGDEVIVVEKCHGSSSRVAMIEEQLMCGSRNLARNIPYKTVKLPYTWQHFKTCVRELRWRDLWVGPQKSELDLNQMKEDWFLQPLLYPGVLELLEMLVRNGNHKQVILNGETYGKVQHLNYGCDGLAWGAYDLLIDGQYVNHDLFKSYCMYYKIPMLPTLYKGPYSLQIIHDLANRLTAVGSDPNQISEGVVVRPVVEKTHPKIGRVIFKYISDAYMLKQEENRETFDVANDESEAAS